MLMNLQSTVECVAFRPHDVHHKFETKSKDNITFESSKISPRTEGTRDEPLITSAWEWEAMFYSQGTDH